MEVCFTGLGSIARRHIRNLCDLYPGIKIDVLRHSPEGKVPDDVRDLIRGIYTDRKELKEDYDAVFITNPTSLHYLTLKEMTGFSKSFFIEKPVFETGREDLAELNLRQDGIYYVACPLRYTNVIRFLKEYMDFSTVHAVRVLASSYLPDWRPGTDYRNTYSAHKALGGGVSIDLIHEWDYLYYLLGKPSKVKSIITKTSNLEIDSDDIAVYIAEYPGITAEVHLDYFGRVSERTIELFMEEDTVQADLNKQRICWKKSGETVDLMEERGDYQKKELMHFFAIVKGELPNDNDIEEACQVLRTARGDMEDDL